MIPQTYEELETSWGTNHLTYKKYARDALKRGPKKIRHAICFVLLILVIILANVLHEPLYYIGLAVVPILIYGITWVFGIMDKIAVWRGYPKDNAHSVSELVHIYKKYNITPQTLYMDGKKADDYENRMAIADKKELEKEIKAQSEWKPTSNNGRAEANAERRAETAAFRARNNLS